MDIEIRESGGWTIVAPMVSCLDVNLAAEFKARVQQVVDLGVSRVAVDMSGVSYVDTSGLGALVLAQRLMEGRGEFALANIGDQFLALLKITGLDRIFRLVDSHELLIMVSETEEPERRPASPPH